MRPKYLQPGPVPAPATPSGATRLQATWQSSAARSQRMPMLSCSGACRLVQLPAGSPAMRPFASAKRCRSAVGSAPGDRMKIMGACAVVEGKTSCSIHAGGATNSGPNIASTYWLHFVGSASSQSTYRPRSNRCLCIVSAACMGWRQQHVMSVSQRHGCLFPQRNAHGGMPAASRPHLDDEQVLKGSQLFAPAARHLCLQCVSSPRPPGSAVCRKARGESSKGGHAAFEGRG